MWNDPFEFFRYLLGTIVTIYASIITFQSLYGWYVWLAGGDKYISMVRRYVFVHALRLRFQTFWGDVIICVLLTWTFFILWHAHGVLRQFDRTMTVLRADQKLHQQLERPAAPRPDIRSGTRPVSETHGGAIPQPR
jgi:hypothetical protein